MLGELLELLSTGNPIRSLDVAVVLTFVETLADLVEERLAENLQATSWDSSRSQLIPLTLRIAHYHLNSLYVAVDTGTS